MIDKVLDLSPGTAHANQRDDASIAAQSKMTYSSTPVEPKQVQDLATKQENVGK